MNVKSFEKKEKNTAELTVVISPEEFDKAVDAAYKKNKGKISIPGFRKGKAPRKIIENMYGANLFFEDAIEIIHPDAYRFGVENEKLNPVGMPTVTDIDIAEDKTVTVTYSLALYPEVVLGEYKGLSAEKYDETVTDDDINNELEAVRNRNARMVTVERVAKLGDTAMISFEGFIDGVPFAGGQNDNYPLVIGSRKFIPGFEDGVIGLSAGDEKDLDLVFPEEYADEFAGKAVVFKIKVLEVKESQPPELDDEFAKDVSEFDTLEEYKNSLKDTVAENKKKEVEKAFEDALLTQVIENMECEVPDMMIEDQIDSAIQNFNYSLSTYGMDIEMYFETMNITMETFRENMRPSSEKQLKISLALEKIAETENIEPTEEEIDEGYKKLADKYGMEMDAAKSSINPAVVLNELKAYKASQLVIDSATATKPKKLTKKTTKKADDAADTDGAAPEEEAAKPAAKKPAAKKTGTTAAAKEKKEPAAKTDTDDKPKKTTKKTPKKTDETPDETK